MRIKEFFKNKYIIVASLILVCATLYANITVIGGIEKPTSYFTVQLNVIPMINIEYLDSSGLSPAPVIDPNGSFNMQTPQFTGGLSSSFVARLKLSVNTSVAAGGASFVQSTLKVDNQTILMKSVVDLTTTFPLTVGLSNTSTDSTGAQSVTLNNPVFTGYTGDALTSYLIFNGSIDSTTTSKPNGLYLAQSGVTITLEWN